MMKDKSIRKPNPAFCAALVLLYLALVSSCMVSGLLGKYTTTSSASDSARVAKFSVSSGYSGSQTFDMSLKPYEPKTVNVLLTNSSEVAVSVSVKLESAVGTLNLPLSVTCDGLPVTLPDTHTLNLAPNSGATTLPYVLSLTSPNPVYAGQLDKLILTVTAVQID